MSHAYFVTPLEQGFHIRVVSGFHIKVEEGTREFHVDTLDHAKMKTRVAELFGIEERAIRDLWECKEEAQ